VIFLKTGADKYIVISEFLLRSYADLLPSGKTSLVYNGVSISSRNNRTVNSYTDYLNICCVGILCEQKNQLEILKAIALLKQRGHDNLRLHFIGGKKKDYAEILDRFISEHSLQHMIIFHGHQSTIDLLLCSMNLGIMPSRDEAFGRVTIEYMLHSMPVIASRSGANEEIIKEGMNGFLYDLYAPEQLANRIAYFLKQPSDLEHMGKVACEYAQTNFSSAKNSEIIYSIITNSIKNQQNN
jgi:glycosyltransferase involved in cell wall biosynthesis